MLLCSDPASTAAAVGMNVHVGACSDPVEIPGLVSATVCIRLVSCYSSTDFSKLIYRHTFVSTCSS